MPAKKAAKKAALVVPPFPVECIVGCSSGAFINGIVFGKNKVLTCRHGVDHPTIANSPVGHTVFITLPNGTKFETLVIDSVKPNLRISKTEKMAAKAKDDRYWMGDVCILTTKDIFPVTPVPIGLFKAGQVTAFHKDRTTATHTVTVWSPNWLHAEWSGRKFEPGDSGFPWLQFNKKAKRWEVVGLTSRGSIDKSQTPWEAESPRLGTKLFRPYLI